MWLACDGIWDDPSVANGLVQFQDRNVVDHFGGVCAWSAVHVIGVRQNAGDIARCCGSAAAQPCLECKAVGGNGRVVNVEQAVRRRENNARLDQGCGAEPFARNVEPADPFPAFAGVARFQHHQPAVLGQRRQCRK